MRIIIIFIVFLLFAISFGNYLDNETVLTETDKDELLYNKYMEMDKGLKELVDKSIKMVLPVFKEANEHINISSNCVKEFLQVISGIQKLKLWAISFPDASGKLTDGFASGNSHMLGNYDQCLSSVALKKDVTIDFQGRYCLIYYKPILPNKTLTSKVRLKKTMTAARNVSETLQYFLAKSVLMSYYNDTYGLCVPSGCRKRDIEQVAHYVGEKIYMDLSVRYCHTEDEVPKMTRRKIAIICIFAFFGFLAVIGTMIDYYSKTKKMEFKNLGARILSCFSITSNFPKLIDTKSSNKYLMCIHGVRVLTLFHIMLGHTHASRNYYYSQTNTLTYLKGFSTFFFQIPLTFLPVEVFFFLGGFFNCFSRMKAMEDGKQNTNVFMIIIHRLWRIYPAYIFAILLNLLLTARGPMEPTNPYTEICAQTWWQNLLFINNFYDYSVMCLAHSWYLTCDMQLFLISLVTVPFLLSKSKKGIFLNIAIIVCGLTFTTVWCWIKKMPPTFKFYQPEMRDLLSVYEAYTLPYPHIAPYFAGILMGYFMAVKKDIKVPKVYQIIGWPVACLCFMTMLFITQRWNSGVEYSRLESSLYFSFSRLLYPLGVAWMIFCCITGYGGVINYILSLKLWIPLSRISFMLYLVSFSLQMFYQASKKTTEDFQVITVIWYYFGDIAVSSLLSIAMVVLTESPFISIEKILFQNKSSQANNDITIDPKNISENAETEVQN